MDIAQLQKRNRLRVECHAAADDDNDGSEDGDEGLSALPRHSTPPRNIFWDLLDDEEPLSDIDDESTNKGMYWEEVPLASSSRQHL